MPETHEAWRIRILGHDAQIRSFTPDLFSFWRNLALFFCIFSVAGHWIEIGYCSFMDLFGIVEEGYAVWDDPMEPYMVYGIATVICTLVLMPLKVALVKRCRTLGGALASLYVICVLVCLILELGMGLLLNQPDATGDYPLWDNSQLPLNVLGQAWLINDLFLGFAANLYIWMIYPICTWLVSLVPRRAIDIASGCVIIAFAVLCAVKLV